MNGNNADNKPIEVIAALRAVPSRPEPPAGWVLAKDTGHAWFFEYEMRARLESYGLDSDLDHYILYVVPRDEFHMRDFEALRVSKARNDLVQRETLVHEDTLMAVRQAARRRKEYQAAR